LAVALGHANESVWSPRWCAMKTSVDGCEGIVIDGGLVFHIVMQIRIKVHNTYAQYFM